MNNPEHEIEGPEPEDCRSCASQGQIYYTSCCGYQVSHTTSTETICPDCQGQCIVEHERCDACSGEGFIPYDEDADRERHLDIMESIATGN